MASLNQVSLIGNIGQDPKMIAARNGGQVAAISLATVERGYTRKDGTKVEDSTEWHNIVCFGKLAEIAQKYVRKGSSVFIQGRLKSRSYEGDDKIKRNITEVIAETLQLLDRRRDGITTDNAAAPAAYTANPQPQASFAPAPMAPANDADANLPF